MGVKMPFDPIEEVKTALMHNGIYPRIKVPKELLPAPSPKLTQTSTHESEEEANAELNAIVSIGHQNLHTFALQKPSNF